jgi:hypothetical protein
LTSPSEKHHTILGGVHEGKVIVLSEVEHEDGTTQYALQIGDLTRAYRSLRTASLALARLVDKPVGKVLAAVAKIYKGKPPW